MISILRNASLVSINLMQQCADYDINKPSKLTLITTFMSLSENESNKKMVNPLMSRQHLCKSENPTSRNLCVCCYCCCGQKS
jgi:hypothetical protein